jgi:hypothetical protein
MGLKRGPWTPEENDRLSEMVAKGASVTRAAGAFARTTVSVRGQALKLGTPFPPNRIARLKWADPPKR